MYFLVTPTMLRRHLARLVPGYMLPAHWMPFERLPKNANGKIDRRRLKELFEERVDLLAPEHKKILTPEEILTPESSEAGLTP